MYLLILGCPAEILTSCTENVFSCSRSHQHRQEWTISTKMFLCYCDRNVSLRAYSWWRLYNPLENGLKFTCMDHKLEIGQREACCLKRLLLIFVSSCILLVTSLKILFTDAGWTENLLLYPTRSYPKTIKCY